jgi:hypothetical protein
MRARLSRRFTTLEGWHEVSTGIYVAGSSRFRVLSMQYQFDADNHDDDRTSWTRPSMVGTVSLQSLDRPIQTDPIEHDAYIESAKVEKGASAIEEPPYHVLSVKEKWRLVIMIGIAGLFSGLSSNIYFPALDAIAKVGSFSTRINSYMF